MFKVVLKATEIAQNTIKEILKKDDIAVDATLGNGKDSIFLSNLVPDGKVYSFEIQALAAKKFEEFKNENKIDNIVLINDGHEKMDMYLKERPMAIMFNLGYLPGGDKSITTMPQTTIAAIEKGLKMLRPGGVMTIEVYKGHSVGEDEAELVISYVRNLSSKVFSVMQTTFLNKSSSAPSLIIIEKNDNCCADIQSNLCLK